MKGQDLEGVGQCGHDLLPHPGRRGGRMCFMSNSLALLIQQVEEAGGLLADEVDTAYIVGVGDVVPGDALTLVLLLWPARSGFTGTDWPEVWVSPDAQGLMSQGPQTHTIRVPLGT